MSTPTLAGARPRVRYRVSDLDYARARDINLFRVRYRVSGFDYTRGRDRALAHARASAHSRALAQARASARVGASAQARARGLREAGRVTPSAAGLVTAAARLLPAADRARYDEEYRSELWELARSGGRRLQQLRYALRQLGRALPAGIALRSPRRRSAAR